MLVAEEFRDGWMRGLRLRDLQVKLKGVAPRQSLRSTNRLETLNGDVRIRQHSCML